MEGQAGRRPRRLDPFQELGGVWRGAAIFAAHLQQGAAQRRHQPHEDAKLGGLAGFGQQLVQLGIAVDDEIGDAMLAERGGGLALQPHRRHEMADRVGQHRLDGFDLAQRRGVEMADARIPQQRQRIGMGIGFGGIEDIAGKAVEKDFRRGGEFVGMDQVERFVRLQRLDRLGGGGETRQGRERRERGGGDGHGRLVGQGGLQRKTEKGRPKRAPFLTFS